MCAFSMADGGHKRITRLDDLETQHDQYTRCYKGKVILNVFNEPYNKKII